VTGGSAFEALVEALLTTEEAGRVPVTAVQVDTASTGNTVIDTGTAAQVLIDLSANAFRAAPDIP
jgi:inulin fructotransferase (DFA-I-forming)